MTSRNAAWMKTGLSILFAGSLIMAGCAVPTRDLLDIPQTEAQTTGTVSFNFQDDYQTLARRADVKQLRITLSGPSLSAPVTQSADYPTGSVSFTAIAPGTLTVKGEALSSTGAVLGTTTKTGVQVLAGQQTKVTIQIRVGNGYNGRLNVGLVIDDSDVVVAPTPTPTPAPTSAPTSAPTLAPTPAPSSAPTTAQGDLVSAEDFSLNVNNLEYTAVWPTVPFHSWRTFHSEWAKVEATKGQMDYSRLDSDVSLAQQHGVEPLFVLSKFPTWVSFSSGTTVDSTLLSQWRAYVTNIATRYKGKVKHYELWNEPSDSFSGTADQLVILSREAYNAIKAVDPSATVVSPAVVANVTYLESFLSKGGGQYCDVLGFHFYVAPKAPEAIATRIDQVKALMTKYSVNKPLWNTETGWRILNHDKNYDTETWAGAPLGDADSMAFIARSYLLSWGKGVKRFYWYAWGDEAMGMTEDDRKTPKPIAAAYAQVRQWMVGARMSAPTIASNGAWVCQLTRDNGYSAWAAWNPTATTSFSVPSGAVQKRDLYGNKQAVSGSVTLGSMPVLFESKSAW